MKIPVIVNAKLRATFRHCLLRDLTEHKPPPWYWPIRSGADPSDWGLDSHEQAELTALHPGTMSKARFEYQNYPLFRGSLGAEHNPVWIIGPRPSQWKDRSTIARLNELLRLVNLKVAHDGSSTGLNYHMSDLIKYQGPRDQRAVCIGVTPHMWQVSFDCLWREYSILGAKRMGVTMARWLSSIPASRFTRQTAVATRSEAPGRHRHSD
jgi:hypothetical protein